MPRLDGLAATRRITTTPAGPDPDDLRPRQVRLRGSLRAGAGGFLLKDASPEDIVAAIRAVARGDAILDPAVTPSVIGQFAALPTPRDDLKAQVDELTAREREVLSLMASGLANAEIAGEHILSREP